MDNTDRDTMNHVTPLNNELLVSNPSIVLRHKADLIMVGLNDRYDMKFAHGMNTLRGHEALTLMYKNVVIARFFTIQQYYDYMMELANYFTSSFVNKYIDGSVR